MDDPVAEHRDGEHATQPDPESCPACSSASGPLDCLNCGETPDKHRESTCPPDFDGRYGSYLPPYATEIEIHEWRGGLLPERGARG